MKLPLRITVATAFALLTVMTVSVITALNYFGSREAILVAAKADISKAAVSAEEGVYRLVGRAVQTADTIASLPNTIFDWRKPENLLISLAISLKASPEIYGVFVGFPDGAFVQVINLDAPDGSQRRVDGMPEAAATAWRVIGPVSDDQGRLEEWRYFDRAGGEIFDYVAQAQEPILYDPRSRSWFKKSQKSGKTSVSKVYVFSSLKQPGITVSKPIRSNPNLSVGVDLSLKDLSGLTSRLSPGKGGVVAIIDDEDKVIAHPNPELIVTSVTNSDTVELVSVSEIDDPRLRFAIINERSDNKKHSVFEANGEAFIATIEHTTESSAASWKIVSVASVSDFTGDLRAQLQHSIIITAIVLMGAICLVIVMAGWIARPFIRLRRMSDKIAQLDLSEDADFKSPFEEVTRLQSSMKLMRGALDTFLRFVPRDVVWELVQSGQAATIGGVKREVTLLFTDVEAFTTMTERMTPEDVMFRVSDYFEELSSAIQTNHGIIDKFIGDAIMAIWNAPSDDVQHADNACRGALGAHHASEKLNAKLAEAGQPIMRTRFGLHTSEVLVGNVGAKNRMQYTCLGSGVNLAARIEGLNKFYGTQILASDPVRRRTSVAFLFRRVDIVEAKGTTVPVIIYELMGESDKGSPYYVGREAIQRASKYEQAFDFYLHRDFADALDVLDKLELEKPGDPVVALLTGKCQRFLSEPPPQSWNGATVLDEK